MDLTLEQQKALALAKARKRKAEAEANGGYGPEWRRGAIAPVMKNEDTGELHWAMPQFAMDAMKVIEAPKRALEGDLQYGSDEFYAIGAMGGAMMAPGATQIAKPGLNIAAKGARNVLRKTLKNDNIPAQDAIKQLDDLGPDGMLMDVGDQTRALAEGIATNMGKARTTVKDAIKTRGAAEAVTGRINDDLTRTLGRSQPAFAIVDDLVLKQKEAATPLYDAVRNVQLADSANITYVLQTPMGKAAYKRALKAAGNEQGYVTDQGLTAGLIDLTKRELDDVFRSATRAGKTSNKARQAQMLSKTLVKAVDEVLPQYKAAREAFAGPEQVKDALNAGLKAFDNKVHPKQLEKQLAEMSFSEREAYLQGVQNRVFDLMGTTRNDALAVRNLLTTGFNKEKLALTIGQESADDLIKAIDREFVFKSTANSVTGGAATAARQVARDHVNPQKANRDGGLTTWGIIKNIFDGARDKLSGMKVSKRNEELAKLLTSNSVDPLMLQKPKLPMHTSPVLNGAVNASSRVLLGTSKPENKQSLYSRGRSLADNLNWQLIQED